MKKRILTVVTAALLVVSMTVTAFAAGSNSGSGAASNASQGSDSSSSSPSTPSAPAAPAPTYTTPTGQPITDALIAALAAAITENAAGVAPVSKSTVIALSNYLKLVAPNAALIAAFKDSGKPGETTIQCGQIFAGTDYSVIIQFADGRVVIIKPKKVVNGKLTYDKPAGAIASISVAANAKAPR